MSDASWYNDNITGRNGTLNTGRSVSSTETKDESAAAVEDAIAFVRIRVVMFCCYRAPRSLFQR